MSGSRARRLGRIVLFGAVVSVPLAFVLRPRGTKGGAPKPVATVPAGGAAQVEAPPSNDAEAFDLGALVEDARRYAVRVWSFALDRYELKIEDAGMTTALDTVLAKAGAELVVNGGFFDPDGKPVGLAVSDGIVLSRIAKALSGGVLTSDGTSVTLFPAEDFALPPGNRFAIQCRPRLVVDRAANVKSDDGKRAERTALCVRDAGRTVNVVIVKGSDDGESIGPSLFALARHLADAGCESALNLDGGPSTGIAWREGDRVNLLPPQRPVRHVVAFRAR
jgi:uncharacterized protein YigE (DUF2233 family)